MSLTKGERARKLRESIMSPTNPELISKIQGGDGEDLPSPTSRYSVGTLKRNYTNYETN